MCTELRVCPVAGCNTLPLKYLLKHLENVHPDLSPEEAELLFRTAAVFRVPAGKKRMDVVVRKGKKTKLQLARKSTGGISEHDGTTAGLLPASRAVQYDVNRSAEVGSLQCRARKMDKATQCNLLPPGLLEPLDKALCADLQGTQPATYSTPRPQYARKSTSTSNEGVKVQYYARKGTSASAEDNEGGIVRKRNELGLMKKRVKFAENTVPTPTNQPVPAVAFPPAIPMGTGSSDQGITSAGKPCEMVCKWGNWTVIFYETPQFLPHL